MNSKKFTEAMSEIDNKYVDEAISYKKKDKKTSWLKWGAMAACLCLVIGLAIPTILNHNNEGAGTLIGDTEIYPTVMVNGQLYEWRKGAAICDGLPNDCVYYGELTHIDGKTPIKDCEFVSVFSVSGQIYTISENNDCVYLCLTTDWLNETVVVFDLVIKDNVTE